MDLCYCFLADDVGGIKMAEEEVQTATYRLAIGQRKCNRMSGRVRAKAKDLPDTRGRIFIYEENEG